MSKTGYKYRKWDDEFTKRIITHQELYFSNPKDFNDIFDCRICGTIGGVNPEDYSWEDKKEGKIRRLLTDSLSFFNKQTVNFVDKFGVCCFSKRCDSILMWSHYADYHRGICFRFDLDKIIFDGGFAKVRYVKTKPQYDYCNSNEDMLKWFVYKHRDWRYEKEIRGILIPPENCHDNSYRKVYFPKEALKEIIFGAKYQDTYGSFGQVIELCQEYGYNVEYSIMQETTISDAYKLQRVPLSIDWNKNN